ncbi:MAG TPA: peptidase M56, partial [Colwellia sp.]|nr:peptidase M56 [Colwellia sp.]
SGSIAQQLLTSKELLRNSSVIKTEQNQGISILPLSNEAGLTTAIVEPIAISDYQNTINTEAADKYNQFTNLKANNEVLAKVEGSVQKNSTAITQLRSTKADVLKSKNSSSSSTKVQQLAKTKSLAQITLTTTAIDKLQAQTAIAYTSQEGDQQLSRVNDKTLSSKKDTYRQFSYKQEVNKLAEQNKLYQASSAVSTDKNLIPEAIKIESSKKEAMQAPTSFEAKLLNSINPIYPNLAKRRGLEMEVKVDFTIDRDGKVKDINFSQQSKLIYFKSAIRSAIRKWRFSPATINNRKVESKMSKIFSFSLHA